jgi:putative transposase
MLVGVRTQEDLWVKECIMPQINKAKIERILNAEKDFHTKDTEACRIAGNSRNGYGKKTLKVNFGHLELSTPRDRHSTFEPQIIPNVLLKPLSSKRPSCPCTPKA